MKFDSKKLNDLDKTHYAEVVAEFLTGKIVEIYLGDNYETIKLEQTESSYPSVICGKVLGARGECLVVNIISIDKSNQVNTNGIMFINGYNIKSTKEIDGTGTIESSMVNSMRANKIKEQFEGK